MRLLACLLFCTGSFAATAVAQPARDITLTPVEIAAAFSYDIRGDQPSATDRGAGGIVSVSGNVNDHVAVTAEFAASSRMTSIAAGPRVSTGFYRDGAGNIPGRFFATALIGRHGGSGGAPPGTAIQVGAGADVLVVRRGLSLHWALDYLFTPGSRDDLSGARVSVGIVVGPHRRRP